METFKENKEAIRKIIFVNDYKRQWTNTSITYKQPPRGSLFKQKTPELGAKKYDVGSQPVVEGNVSHAPTSRLCVHVHTESSGSPGAPALQTLFLMSH